MTLQELLKAAQGLSFKDQVYLASRLLELVERQVEEEHSNLVTEIRQPGLHLGAFVMTEDFDDPLPDGFWLGEL
jgi:hypothetical protein